MILAFDPGKETGYAVIDKGKLIEYGTVRQTGELKYLGEISDLYLDITPEVVFIEKPFVGRNPVAICSLARTVQMIRIAVLTEYPEALIVEVSPSEVKKGITGSGSAKKEQVKKMVEQLFKETAGKDITFDQSDAIALAYMGERLLKQSGKA
jgi:crossover junction endodeoxyribonuclease RuvC